MHLELKVSAFLSFIGKVFPQQSNNWLQLLDDGDFLFHLCNLVLFLLEFDLLFLELLHAFLEPRYDLLELLLLILNLLELDSVLFLSLEFFL